VKREVLGVDRHLPTHVGRDNVREQEHNRVIQSMRDQLLAIHLDTILATRLSDISIAT
jgi:hypothetical protein